MQWYLFCQLQLKDNEMAKLQSNPCICANLAFSQEVKNKMSLRAVLAFQFYSVHAKIQAESTNLKQGTNKHCRRHDVLSPIGYRMFKHIQFTTYISREKASPIHQWRANNVNECNNFPLITHDKG